MYVNVNIYIFRYTYSYSHINRHKLKLRSAFQDYQSLRKDKLLREKISRKMKIKQMMREKAQKENKEKEIDSRTRNSTTSAAPTVRNADNGDEKKKKVRAFEDTRATAVEIKSYFNYDGIRAGSGDVTNDVADGNGTCDASARKNQMKTVNADKSMKSQHINTEKTSSASSLGVSGGASNNEPDFTNYTATFKGCLDYIFFSHSEKDNSDDTDREGGIGRGTEDARGTLLLQSIGCLPTLEQASAHTAFPSPVCPSDHIPLMASFAMSP